METLGTLIDKLSIANCKIWHLEDQRNDKSLSDSERLIAADKLTLVNKYRNNIVQEIDELLHNYIKDSSASVIPYVRIDPQ